MTRPERSVVLRPDDAGDFTVELVPPVEDGMIHGGTFPTYKRAKGHAGGLRLVLGVPLVDLTAEGKR